jgi:UDP-N-acetylglucosamine acyltransferase
MPGKSGSSPSIGTLETTDKICRARLFCTQPGGLTTPALTKRIFSSSRGTSVRRPSEANYRGAQTAGKISPWAVVSPSASIGQDVEIGPFCVIEPNVTVDDGCVLDAHVVLKSGTTLGPNNRIFEGAVIGGLPQHLHVPENPGGVVIGSGNTIRENVTIHRSLDPDEATSIGDNNLLMVNTHVAHDCRVGNNVIMTNNSMLAGHVTVGDRAYLSGAAAAHQFCRIGSLAMVGGQAHLVKDVPPFVTVDGLSSLVVGLNQIGLRRAGYSGAEVRRLKDAYRVIYRSGLTWNEILAKLREEFTEGLAASFYQFLSTTTRGITCERRPPPGATIRINTEADEMPRLRARAG